MYKLIIVVLLFASPVIADTKIGVFTNSQHYFDTEFMCNGIMQSYNEINPGAYIIHRNIIIGVYENSYANCEDGREKNSLLVGYNYDYDEYLSGTIGVAQYSDGPRGWVTVSGVFKNGFKLWYGITVIGAGWEFNL